MKAIKTLMLLGVVAAVVLAGTSTAWALGADTDAGTSIDNTAVLTFDAGQATGNTTSDTANFLVDRNVVFTNTNATAATVQVFPGDANIIVQFDLQNDTNDVVDLLVVLNGTSTAASVATLWVDTGAAGCDTADIGGTAVGAYLDEVAEDATPTICLEIDSDSASAQGTTYGYSVEVQAAMGGSVAVQGAALADDNAAAWLQTTVQNALGDGAGYADTTYDGFYNAHVVVEVVTATLTVTKTITAVNDFAGYTTIDKAIPGAVVSYRVVVDNSGSGTATNVSLTDTLDLDIDVVDVGNYAASAGSAPVESDNNLLADTIFWSIGSVAGGTSVNMTYDVTIPN